MIDNCTSQIRKPRTQLRLKAVRDIKNQGARSALIEGNYFAPQLFAEESVRILPPSVFKVSANESPKVSAGESLKVSIKESLKVSAIESLKVSTKRVP